MKTLRVRRRAGVPWHNPWGRVGNHLRFLVRPPMPGQRYQRCWFMHNSNEE